MGSGSKTTRRLRDGDAVSLMRETGERLRGVVVGVEDDAVDVVLRGQIADGELLQVSRTIPDDARYEGMMEVVQAAPGRSRVRLVGDWQRIQMREFVRVSVYGIPMNVEGEDREALGPRERLKQHRSEGPLAYRPPRLLDLSAGGLRFESREEFRDGEALDLEFSLPSSGPISVRGEVVRVRLAPEPAEGAEAASGPHQYGIRFFALEESTRVKIMAWVFSEQARRFRESKRKR